LGVTGGCEWLFQIIKNRPVRRDVALLEPNDPILETYKAAVSAMRALPASDRRSWTRQASIHNDHCPHSNWFFLPWHRAYLFYFERLCRYLAGNRDFALPYWNWTKDKSVPSAFWGAANPLFDGTRQIGASDMIADEFVGASVVEGILEEPNFLVFGSGQSSTQRGASVYGSLEATPHNRVHGFIGGDMGSYISPLDPVFWSHHNMIERCWIDWNINGQHANTNDAAWSNFSFNGDFVDENGAPVDIAVNATLLMPIFSYQYDNFTIGSGAPRSLRRWDTKVLEKFLREGAAVRFDFQRRLTLLERGGLTTQGTLERHLEIPVNRLSTVLPTRADERLFLLVENVQTNADDDVFVRVFVGLKEATLQTPISDPHYAGSFAFFGGDHGTHGGQPASFQVDLTETVRRLRAGGGLSAGGSVPIQLVVVPMEGRAARKRSIPVSGISLGITSDASRGKDK
jgi:tyrosinase